VFQRHQGLSAEPRKAISHRLPFLPTRRSPSKPNGARLRPASHYGKALPPSPRLRRTGRAFDRFARSASVFQRQRDCHSGGLRAETSQHTAYTPCARPDRTPATGPRLAPPGPTRTAKPLGKHRTIFDEAPVDRICRRTERWRNVLVMNLARHAFVSPHPCCKAINQRSRSDILACPGKQESDQPIEVLLGAQNCRQPIRRIVEPGSSKVTVTAVRTPASALARWWASIGSERCEWHTRSPDVR
jgi:hypothetical protein